MMVRNDALRILYIASLICIHQCRHSYDVRIIFVTESLINHNVRLGFLRVKQIDTAAHEHIGENKILENLDSLGASCLVIISKSLEKVYLSCFPVFFFHVHFTSEFTNDAHSSWMWNSIGNIRCLEEYLLDHTRIVQLLIHLDFKGIKLKDIGPMDLCVRLLVAQYVSSQVAKHKT